MGTIFIISINDLFNNYLRIAYYMHYYRWQGIQKETERLGVMSNKHNKYIYMVDKLVWKKIKQRKKISDGWIWLTAIKVAN